MTKRGIFELIPGSKFENLTVISRSGYIGHEKSYLCKCDCGKEACLRQSAIFSGKTKSCGCRLRKHGLHQSSTYHSWQGIRERCCNKNSEHYLGYGAKGIKRCERWKYFKNFLEDMGEKPSSKHSIDRIDNSKGYCKENCRWATHFEQMANRKTTKFVNYKGKKRNFTELCREVNADNSLVAARLRIGWSIQKALTFQIRKFKRRSPKTIEYKGRLYKATELSLKLFGNKRLLHSRLVRGMSIQCAIKTTHRITRRFKKTQEGVYGQEINKTSQS